MIVICVIIIIKQTKWGENLINFMTTSESGTEEVFRGDEEKKRHRKAILPCFISMLRHRKATSQAIIFS